MASPQRSRTLGHNPPRQSQDPPRPTGGAEGPGRLANRDVNRSSYGSATKRDRLPTLQEVLARKTRPPVDLYCFYLYLQRERAEDALDFWLDAQQHENLCRAYFKDLRKSGVMLADEWPGYEEKARTRGSVYNGVNGITRDSMRNRNSAAPTPSTSHPDKKSIPPNASPSLSGSRPHSRDEGGQHDVSISRHTPSPSFGMASGAQGHLSPTMRALFPHDRVGDEPAEEGRRSGATSGMGGARPKTPAQPIIPRSSAITRTDLIASAERIYYRYLLTGAEKEIYLPPPLRLHDFPLSSGSLPHAGSEDWEEETKFLAEVPDLFVGMKEYVYRSMEQDTFPRFLRAKAFGNLTPLSALVRLAVGLVAVWAGLSTAFALIFLDVHPRRTRFWIVIPFSIGILCVVAHFYDLDPILMLFGLSETTPFRTLKVKEPYVKKILRGRAIWVTILSAIIVTALCAIFISVPGHRL